MSLLAFAILLVPSVAYAGHEGSTWTWNEGYGPEEIKECQFTANIEKSWVFFTERPWVTGFVINCDNEIEYHLKDTVYVRVLDINGDLVEDDWKSDKDTAKTKNNNPTKYIFNDQVYRGGAQGNADVSEAETVYIRENQYFFYMPQINSVDFEHRGVYQIELTYGEHVRTIWFASFSPDIPWQQDKVDSDFCNDFEEELNALKNTITALETQIDRYVLLDQQEKVSATIESLDKVEKQIELLKEC